MVNKFHIERYETALAAFGIPETLLQTLRACRLDILPGFEASSRSVSMFCHSPKSEIPCKVGSKLECAGKFTFDYSTSVAGYYFKAGQLPISFGDESGRKCGIRHRPDVLRLLTLPVTLPASGLILSDYVRFAEFKTWNYLEGATRRGDRYVFDRQTGKYRSPSAEKAASEIGFGYDLITERDLDQTIVANVEFLYAHFGAKTPAVPADIIDQAREAVRREQGISCSGLLATVEGLTMDRFCKLLVDQKLFVPLDSCHLDMPSTVQVFSDQLTAGALLALIPTKRSDQLIVRQKFPRFEPNEIITIRGQNHTVVISGTSEVQFRTDKGDSTTITREELERLLKERQLSSLGVPRDANHEARQILLSTPPSRLRAALERSTVIQPVLDGSLRPRDAKRRLANFSTWLRRAKEASRRFGSALIGLIDGRNRQGHRGSHLSPADEALISESIETTYASSRAPKKSSAYASYRLLCKNRGQRPVSEKSFRRRIRRYAADWLERRRNGEMAASAVAAPVSEESPLYGGGRWFMHIAHLDEGVFDIATIFPEAGIPLGTAWVVIMFDSYTRTVLAAVATYEAPSYVTTMALLRECVSRWGRLPEVLFMDNGPGFKNDSLKLFAEYYSVQLCWRPPGKPRWGSELERFLGDLNQRVADELPGATKKLTQLRRVSRSHHPERLASMGLQAVCVIVRDWCYTLFDGLPHRGLDGKSPAEMRAISQREHGDRLHLCLSGDPLFQILSLPSPSADGTAKVQAHDGVQVDNLYYWHDSFYDPEVVGTRIQVRYDPFDITRVYAFIRDQWVQCDCLKLRRLRELSPEDLCAASLEIRKSRAAYNRRRGEILERVEAFLNVSGKAGEELTRLLRTKESARQFVARRDESKRNIDGDEDDVAGTVGTIPKPPPPNIPGYTRNLLGQP